MPCYRCGARQTDPVRGASPWKRAVRHEAQVLVCPDCQREHDLDLDTCATCGSIALICRLGEVECRSCGHVHSAGSGPDETPVAAGSLIAAGPPGSSAASARSTSSSQSSSSAPSAASAPSAPSASSGLAAEVEAALSRVLGRP
ncbi:hypothetical protein [Microbispora oryzae]|uniref:hypothetical protein n=1 Tax=Microbispora oryzae TaxID=2806554 RepID=UPI001E38286D|nr:hypothetical protein [Microbispora oryzae]